MQKKPLGRDEPGGVRSKSSRVERDTHIIPKFSS